MLAQDCLIPLADCSLQRFTVVDGTIYYIQSALPIADSTMIRLFCTFIQGDGLERQKVVDVQGTYSVCTEEKRTGNWLYEDESATLQEISSDRTGSYLYFDGWHQLSSEKKDFIARRLERFGLVRSETGEVLSKHYNRDMGTEKTIWFSVRSR